MIRVIAYLSVCFLLQGCLFTTALQAVDESVQFARQKVRNIVNGPEEHPARKDYADIAGYCYRTLAHVDCYDSPRIGQEYRLAGYVQPPHGEALAGTVLQDYVSGMRDEADRERLRAIEEAEKKRLAKKREMARVSALPKPKGKPSVPDAEPPLDLLKFELGDKEYTLTKPPSEEELNF